MGAAVAVAAVAVAAVAVAQQDRAAPQVILLASLLLRAAISQPVQMPLRSSNHKWRML
jgi:uncharacterized membrane protein YoaK (UPF0700 family)